MVFSQNVLSFMAISDLRRIVGRAYLWENSYVHRLAINIHGGIR